MTEKKMPTKFLKSKRNKDRFTFGKNWKAYSNILSKERIDIAIQSLQEMLNLDDLSGTTFLDVGSGSGLFSLAARRLGARVHSFDYDTESVKCTLNVKQTYLPKDDNWSIEEGDVLDQNYLKTLGTFDVVYSWGVLHHTGKMDVALENVDRLVRESGLLYIAIYNDQGAKSVFWRNLKKLYCTGMLARNFIAGLFVPLYFMKTIFSSLVKYGNLTGAFSDYKNKRGMSIYHDWLDWLGGYPYEVAKPEYIFYFYKTRNYVLEELRTTNTHGCNQFVFKKGCGKSKQKTSENAAKRTQYTRRFQNL